MNNTAVSKLDYRPDIDGLRAIAVLAVLIYHAGFHWQGAKLLAGGYLGVDIFFVISGYLICGILIRELHAEQFSFAAFYARRARRILPALFLVMLCSAIVAPFLLSHEAYKELSSSIAAAGAFVSNFFFWLQDSYTAEPSLRKPLLHTWSLAIEEQFYLLFPLILWLVWKKAAGKYTLILALVAISSFLYAEWGSYYFPSANFYLLPSRIWELMVGAILAVMHSQGRFKQASGLISWLGLALVISSLVMLDDTTRHPSLWTLLPVVGTALLIMNAPTSTALNKLLSSKLMVGIGLLSYSLYLWHQPVFAFARVYTGSELTVWHKFSLIALVFILAGVSWRWVETPFRRADKMSQSQTLRALGSCSVVLVIFVVAVQLGGFTSVAASVTKRGGSSPICSGQRYLSQNQRACYEHSRDDACTFISGNGKQKWYLVGDSIADSLAWPLWQRLQDHDAMLTIFTKAVCPYIPGLSVMIDGKDYCEKRDNVQRRKFLLDQDPGIVVIHSLLHIYIHGSRNRPYLEEKQFKIVSSLKASVQDVRRYTHKAIEELLKYGHTVVLVYPIHMADYDVEHLLSLLEHVPPNKRENLLASDRYNKSYREFRAFADVAYHVYDSLGEHPRLIRIKPEKLFCDISNSERCKIVDQGASLYRDFSHLSYLGSCKLVNRIFKEFPLTDASSREFACQPICK